MQRWTDRHIDEPRDMQYIKTDRQIGIQTIRQTNRQTEKDRMQM